MLWNSLRSRDGETEAAAEIEEMEAEKLTGSGSILVFIASISYDFESYLDFLKTAAVAPAEEESCSPRRIYPKHF